MKKKIAILASGSGSNAEKIVDFLRDHKRLEVDSIFSNRSNAGVFSRAKRLAIDCFFFDKNNTLIGMLDDRKIDYIVLAGYLKLIPKSLVEKYPKRILNIHPALLPKYGGKGMYGHHVHQAVADNNEIESGITIHFVDEAYDEGAIVFQQKIQLQKEDDADTIAVKVLKQEHYFYPRVIAELWG